MRYLKTFEKKFGYIVGDYVKHKRHHKNDVYKIEYVDYDDNVFPYKIRNINTNDTYDTSWASPDEIKKLNKFELQAIKYNI